MARILLADDDATSRDLVSRGLAADGHKVVSTNDGGEALDKLGDTADGYDMLVTDVQMPVLDGISLAERALSANPQLRILFMSGYASGIDRARSLGGAHVSFLAKPFTLEQIRAAVRSALA